MQVFPQVARKQLGDCEAGELVRKRQGIDSPFALMARNEEHRFLVVLAATGDVPAPYLTLVERPDLWAISYGTAYRIEVSQKAEHVDLTGRRQQERSGTLLIADDHYLMCVSALPGPRLGGTFYVRLDSGWIMPEPAGSVATFGRWSLMLSKGGDRYETLLTIG